ncbi:S-layer family protein [Keratinibaculum paraultunense]|uniref:S-layer family protein n=1 Tax=Keratinibaculum paraultunense TaxID=1278232 RepID=A0A4R3L0Y6_9FIRM|nr:S-layer homology domain-containing protein [Keratinibaculum paraultunense]QQY79978.1 S-layer homology domain-containing protein [Keratinibaculum paraultunense]TCS91701.1 S-layer family protein [Keratinibaculum paraultunense]
MNKKNILNMAIMSFIIILFNSTFSFAMVSDIESHWAKKEIAYLIERGDVQGYNDGTFKPNKNITRAEFFKMTNNVYGFKEVSEVSFKDVKKDDWYFEEVGKAIAAGYIGGYEDGTIRPNKPITREEAAKIIVIASELKEKIEDIDLNFVDSHEIGSWAKNYVKTMKSQGYMKGYEDGTFRPKRQITRGETAKIFADIIKNANDNQTGDLDINDTLEIANEEDMIKPVEPIKIISKHEEFIKLANELPNPNDIKEIVATDKIKVENLRKLYNSLTQEDIEKISKNIIHKFEEVEAKIESLKTPIKLKSQVSMEQAQVWAIRKGAHKRFIDIAPYYWEYGRLTGINPEILYAQAAKETNFGRYTGQVKPEMNNWAGIKIADSIGDNTYDHEIFSTPEDGVRAHFNHIGLYCGIDPIGDPHSRWYKTKTASWAGNIQYVEDLGERWAPHPDYGISIMRDYVSNIYKTSFSSIEDLNIALEFSQKFDELEEYDESIIDEVIKQYNFLTENQKALIPYNINEKIDEINKVNISKK